MGNIRIRTITSGPKTTIEADSSPDGKNGNLPVNPKASIAWKADVAGERFQVFFFDLEYPTVAIWPFKEGNGGHPPDGYAGPGSQENPYLLVESTAKPRRLKSSAPVAIKYDVVAVHMAGVDRLDPVIIIRTGRNSPIAALLSWATVGAATGALITWWILTQQ
jgi:hypothetical protein